MLCSGEPQELLRFFLLKKNPNVMHPGVQCALRWSVEFFYRSEQVNLPKVRYDFRNPNGNFWCTARQSFIYKKISIFFVKKDMKILLH